MENSNRKHHRASPRSERERNPPHEHDDVDEQRAKRRRDEYGHGGYTRTRRSRSPRRLEHAGHRHHDRGDARHGRHETRHGASTAPINYNGRSPRRHTRSRSRSRSPTRHRPSHRRDNPHRRHGPTSSHRPDAPELPCAARALSRSADFDAFRPLFARYLDVQKQLDIAALDEREVRGRWKSFVTKWNGAELAEGWYRPETFEDAVLDFREGDADRRGSVAGDGRGGRLSRRARDEQPGGRNGATRRGVSRGEEDHDDEGDDDNDDDDDAYGPTLPPRDDDAGYATSAQPPLPQTKHGPGIPSLSDLTLRAEQEASDAASSRAHLRLERAADRALQKERLEELAPRADAGTAARRLEKRRETRAANDAFASGRAGGEAPEVGDAELMGGGGGGVEEYKRLKREAERRRTEREVRREEVMRARREEREERVRELREREEHTVDMLREMARSRFG